MSGKPFSIRVVGRSLISDTFRRRQIFKPSTSHVDENRILPLLVFCMVLKYTAFVKKLSITYLIFDRNCAFLCCWYKSNVFNILFCQTKTLNSARNFVSPHLCVQLPPFTSSAIFQCYSTRVVIFDAIWSWYNISLKERETHLHTSSSPVNVKSIFKTSKRSFYWRYIKLDSIMPHIFQLY